MEYETFQIMPVADVARVVQAAGPRVCVFPINGTRRWFLLEQPAKGGQTEDLGKLYLDASTRRHVELYRLFFEHGVHTLLTPVFGPDLLDRGEDYMPLAAEGLSRLATHPEFVGFYDACEVRVRFYGDHRAFFKPTPYAYLSDLFDEVTARTAANNRYRLFFGVCAQEATDTIARLSVSHYLAHGVIPDKRTLIALYYGEDVGPVDLFIGFDKPCVFDMPLVATGSEDLYFTVSPSPYLSQAQLRDILFDHLYMRRGSEPDYASMDEADWRWMREFYWLNRKVTIGVGCKSGHGRVWYPLSEIKFPSTLERNADTKTSARNGV